MVYWTGVGLLKTYTSLTTTNYEYSSAGNYTVKMVVVSVNTQTNATCTDTISKNIQLSYLPCAAAIRGTHMAPFDHGEYELAAEDLANTGNMTYYWDWGDGNYATGDTVSHYYNLPDIYTVKLMATNGTCTTNHSWTGHVNYALHCWTDTTDFSYTTNNLTANFTSATYVSAPRKANHTWFFGDYTHDTVANPSHTYAKAGTYHVVMYTFYEDEIKGVSCGDTIKKTVTVYAKNSTNVNDISANQPVFDAYPNPANDIVTLNWKNAAAIPVSVSLTDITGKVVLKQQAVMNEKLTMPLSGTMPGLYFINVSNQYGSTTKKLIVR